MKNNNNKFNTFPKNLKNYRISLHLTQKEVATKMGVSYQAYQAYEHGLNNPSLDKFIKLCEIFDVTPNELLDY